MTSTEERRGVPMEEIRARVAAITDEFLCPLQVAVADVEMVENGKGEPMVLVHLDVSYKDQELTRWNLAVTSPGPDVSKPRAFVRKVDRRQRVGDANMFTPYDWALLGNAPKPTEPEAA